ncbi:MAG: hypothetical protein ACK4TB_17520 [Gemmobacter sp.]
MSRTLVAILAATLVVAGCATVRDSRVNPFNWFGRSAEARAVARAPAARVDPRQPIAQVTELAVEPTPGGAIIRATGLPPTQGHWDAALVLERPEEGASELVYRFLVQPPRVPRPAGTPMSREVTVALFASNIRLEGVRRITVTGDANARSVNRR